MDERYVIKQLQPSERSSFLEFAPEYFSYMASSIEGPFESLLARIYGVFRVHVRYTGRQLSQQTMDLLVMENVLYGHRLARRYDLKGLERRVVEDSADDAVLHDGNMMDTLKQRPLYVD